MVASNASARHIAGTEPVIGTSPLGDVQQDNQPKPAPKGSPSADRMRLSRQRRREGMRVIPFEARDSEMAALVARGYLAPADANSRDAIATALGTLLDQMPPKQWPMKSQNT